MPSADPEVLRLEAELAEVRAAMRRVLAGGQEHSSLDAGSSTRRVDYQLLCDRETDLLGRLATRRARLARRGGRLGRVIPS